MRKTIIALMACLTLTTGAISLKNEIVLAKEGKNKIVAAIAVANAHTLSRGGIPIQTKAAKNSYTPKYGELLSWKKSDNLIPRGTTVKVTDLGTGKTFSIKRTFGTNHLDGEAPSIDDTKIIKSIWGGFSWERRPVVVTINGKSIAASMSAMPHAGLDSQPSEATVSNRSDGYGRGVNLDAIKNNGMDGVIDIHFLNSTRHKDNKPDPEHQAAILEAAGK